MSGFGPSKKTKVDASLNELLVQKKNARAAKMKA